MSEYCEARRETNPLAGLTSGFARILTGTHSLTGDRHSLSLGTLSLTGDRHFHSLTGDRHFGNHSSTLPLTGDRHFSKASLGTDTLVRLLNAGIRSGKYETAEVEN